MIVNHSNIIQKANSNTKNDIKHRSHESNNKHYKASQRKQIINPVF